MTTKAILSFFWEVTPLNPWTVSYIYTAEALLSQCNRWSMGTSTITPSLGHAKIKCTGQMRNTLKHLATRLHQMKRVKGNSIKLSKPILDWRLRQTLLFIRYLSHAFCNWTQSSVTDHDTSQWNATRYLSWSRLIRIHDLIYYVW